MRILNGMAPARRPLRILMRNRRDSFSHPGGDTVLMARLREGLGALGHTVDIDLESVADARSYDLVHLFNLTLPGLIGPLARDASDKGVPFLVHALQEDWPRFLNRSLAAAVVLEKYVASGQPRERLDPALALLRECPPAAMPLSPEAGRAAAILCTGSEEVATVRRHYPATAIKVVPLATGSGTGDSREDAGADFRQSLGTGDFVLCVGRLEPRKNQLMLLAALEEDDITVVFVDGGFAYAPEYAEACRRFVRRGRTLFTGRLPEALLRSAYRCARVSCLPSWYELPGLATLEAAQWGRNVVAGTWGTIGDYLGREARYVEPDDAAGLRHAVLAAWESPANPRLNGLAAGFTWAGTARAVESVYLEATGRFGK